LINILIIFDQIKINKNIINMNFFGRVFGKRLFNRFGSRRFYSDKVQKIEVITQDDKKRWYQRPFRSYFRVGGATFGLCLGANTVTSLFDQNRRELVAAHPDIFAWSVLSKSCYFGLVWPSFYLKSILRPREAFYLFGGIENMANQFGEGLENMEVSGTVNGREMTPEELNEFRTGMEEMKKSFKELFGGKNKE